MSSRSKFGVRLPVRSDNSSKCWPLMRPNLFIVGAMKCGTTTAYEMLCRTPHVAMCRQKEPNYFCTDLYASPDFDAWGPRSWIRDENEYLSLFPDQNGRWFGEASPNYLYSEVAASRIYAFNPMARIVILLRSPIHRAYSEYLMQLRMGKVTAPFSDLIREDLARTNTGIRMIHARYVSAGMYAQQVERYLREFPQERIFVEVVDRPGVGFANLREGLSDFLGIDAAPLQHENRASVPALPGVNRLLFETGIKDFVSRTFPKSIRSRAKKYYYRSPSSSEMANPDREFLMHAFRKDIERLSSLLGEDLSFWLSGSEAKTESQPADGGGFTTEV